MSVTYKNIYLKVYEVLDHMFVPEETIVHLLQTINTAIIPTDTCFKYNCNKSKQGLEYNYICVRVEIIE